MALSANAGITYLEPTAHRPKSSSAVAGSVRIYSGAFVGKNPAGYLKPFQAGDEFVGISEEEFYNSSATAGAASDVGTDGERGKLKCLYTTAGHFAFTLSSVAITDIQKPVFATDDNTLSLTGHPDAFVGYVTEVYGTNTAMIRMRNAGERAPNGVGSQEVASDFAFEQFTALDENDGYINGKWRVTGVGAGLTAGTTGVLGDHDNGELVMLLDNDSEVQSITLDSGRSFNITKGVTFEFEGRKSVAGAATNSDVDFGLAGGIDLTTTQFADMQATTSSFLYALFHIDAEDDNVDMCSDNNTTVVAPTDTTIDNSTSANKRYKVIVRADGTVEGWINEARVLSSTSFAVGASGLLAGIVNLEKASSTDVAEVRIRKIRVAGALA